MIKFHCDRCDNVCDKAGVLVYQDKDEKCYLFVCNEHTLCEKCVHEMFNTNKNWVVGNVRV